MVRRRHRVVVLTVLAVAALMAGLSIAAAGWLTGKPAPPAVVNDFRGYATQLGFHPEPGKAVLVAEDGAIKLYATINREGTYCLVWDEPWKPPQAGDGTCVQKSQAAFPITAGWIGGSNSARTWVIAGRVTDSRARTVRFSAPDGTVVERSVGSGGFYVAAVKFAAPGCPREDWEPTFEAVGRDGDSLLKSRILLIRTDKFSCGGAVSPHGPYPSDS